MKPHDSLFFNGNLNHSKYSYKKRVVNGINKQTDKQLPPPGVSSRTHTSLTTKNKIVIIYDYYIDSFMTYADVNVVMNRIRILNNNDMLLSFRFIHFMNHAV